MPAAAAIAPAPPAVPAVAVLAAAASADGKLAPFHLELEGAPAGADQAAKPAAAEAPKPSSVKTADQQATDAAQPGLLAWLMAALGGSAAPAAAADAEPQADDGMPTATAVPRDAAAVARPEPKPAGAAVATVQPLPAAADPAAVAAQPAVEAKEAAQPDADVIIPATPKAVATPHDPVPAHTASPEPQAAFAQARVQAVAEATANLQGFARALDDSRPAAPAPAPHPVLNTAHAEWPHALADQVQWQLGREVQEARLELHPRELGAVQVQVRITSEGAEVRFAATHPQAREALEAALPQLRSLLQTDGIALAQTQVGAQSSWQAPARQRPPAGPNAGAAAAGEDEPVAARPRVVRLGLVDDFA
jgi:flagellar hook-length control protein FliK